MNTHTEVKAGSLLYNHNESQVRDAAPGLKVQTNVKAAALSAYHPGTRGSVATKWTYRAQKSRRRRRAQVEVLEERQLLATITVNMTADATTAGATLSLRQAIEVSDGTLAVSSLSTQEQAQVSGAIAATNTINFNIPMTDSGYDATTGAWTIFPRSALPAITTNAAIIDGYSQPGASQNTLAQGDNAKLLIAINEAAEGTVSGLTIAAPGSQVRGLDVENSLGSGILVTAPGNVQVAGNFIGTGPNGETYGSNINGLVIENSSNLIGGPNVGDRNIISGNGHYEVFVPDQSDNPLNIQPTDNVIENNYIGVDATGSKALSNIYAGVYDSGTDDTYGGTTAGLGNVISGNARGGIEASGSITVEGNYVGSDATGTRALGNGDSDGSPGITDEGTAGAAISTTISDNLVLDNMGGGISVSPGSQSLSSFTIANNLIGVNAAGPVYNGGNGAFGLQLTSVENTKVLDNVISGNIGVGIELSGLGSDVAHNVIQGNQIGFYKNSPGNITAGLLLTNAIGTTVGGSGPGQGNVFYLNAGDGIDVDGGQQNQITRNSIYANFGRGIKLDSMATNQSATPPVITFSPGAGGNGTLAGSLTASPNLTYTIEIFSNQVVDPAGYEQGETFVQAVPLTTDASGGASFSVTLPVGIYTATATDPNGNTSTFSNSVGSPGLPASTTAVSSSANPSTAGAPVTFTAVVTAPGFRGTPTGTVTFTVDGQAQSPVQLSVVGGADEAQFVTSTLTAGAHSVTANYSGDSHVGPSSGLLPTQTVNGSQLPATTTTLTSSENPAPLGQPVTFTSVVTAPGFRGTPTGTVTFTVDGQAQSPVQLSVVGGADEAQFVTSTLTAGAHSVTANYSGDTSVSGSSAALPTQTVTAPGQHATTTTLASSPNPATAGQSVSFTAMVSPDGAAGTPTGSVTFTIDGVSQKPVPLNVVGGKDEATASIASLAKGTHTIRAAYSGNTSFAASAVASPLVQTVEAVPVPAGDGPKVELVQRFGVHMHPTVLVVSFNEALDPASAVNLDNYKITDPAGSSVRIRSAVFDAATNTVTLRPMDRINLHHTYHLTLVGTGPGGIRNTQGALLDGSATGSADGDYMGTLTWRNVVLTAAEVRKYDHPTHAKPAGALNHHFLGSNRSSLR